MHDLNIEKKKPRKIQSNKAVGCAILPYVWSEPMNK